MVEVYLEIKKYDHRSYAWDWKNNKRGWQYDGDIDDPKYLEDRAKLFKENGNGWWYYHGFSLRPSMISDFEKRNIKGAQQWLEKKE